MTFIHISEIDRIYYLSMKEILLMGSLNEEVKEEALQIKNKMHTCITAYASSKISILVIYITHVNIYPFNLLLKAIENIINTFISSIYIYLYCYIGIHIFSIFNICTPCDIG